MKQRVMIDMKTLDSPDRGENWGDREEGWYEFIGVVCMNEILGF